MRSDRIVVSTRPRSKPTFAATNLPGYPDGELEAKKRAGRTLVHWRYATRDGIRIASAF